MRGSSLALGRCVVLALAAGCDRGELVQLRGDLALAPTHQAVTAWVGHTIPVTVSVTNRGQARVDLQPLALSGASAALGAEAPPDGGRIGPGRTEELVLTLSPTAPPTGEQEGEPTWLTLTLTPLNDEVACSAARRTW